jgi:hypothetical protein
MNGTETSRRPRHPRATQTPRQSTGRDLLGMLTGAALPAIALALVLAGTTHQLNVTDCQHRATQLAAANHHPPNPHACTGHPLGPVGQTGHHSAP